MGPLLAIGAVNAGLRFWGASRQVDRMSAENREQLRRMRLGQAQQLGEARALAGDQGSTSDSVSLTTYLDAMAAEMRRQSEWAQKQGQNAVEDAGLAALFGGASDFGTSLMQYGQASNWWKKPSVA